MTPVPCSVRSLTPGEAEANLATLCDLLVDAVEGGASVNFVMPISREKAERFW